MKITKLSDDERIIDLGSSMIYQSKDGFEPGKMMLMNIFCSKLL